MLEGTTSRDSSSEYSSQKVPQADSYQSHSPVSEKTVGEPVAKKTFYLKDIAVAGISFICMMIGIPDVASENMSWRLGDNNYQLILLSFLLSAINLCLNTIAPTLFLLLEARLGSSTLQNYDAILRNQVFATKAGLTWRLTLGFMLALHIGLSVAYKNFSGGESLKMVDIKSYIGNDS